MKKFNSVNEAENWLRQKEGDNVNLDTQLNIEKGKIFFEGGKYEARITINAFCRCWRELQNISQSELARRIGARKATICEFESGKRGINSKTLELIFKELGINLII